ncbi:hypothetical protein LLB_3349 [Legionella longbeachae D-4968]|nr:hypothetical protein LLB_3349 [Legionella longbeachae D-4968]
MMTLESLGVITTYSDYSDETEKSSKDLIEEIKHLMDI